MPLLALDAEIRAASSMSAVSDMIALPVTLSAVSIAASARATAKIRLLVPFVHVIDPIKLRNALSAASPVMDSLRNSTAIERAIFAPISSVAVAAVTVDTNFRSTGSEIVSGVELTPAIARANALAMASDMLSSVAVSVINSAEYDLVTGKDMPGVLLDPDKIAIIDRAIWSWMISKVELAVDSSPEHDRTTGKDMSDMLLAPDRIAISDRATGNPIVSGVELNADSSPAHDRAIGTDIVRVVLLPTSVAAIPRATSKTIASVLLTALDVADKEIEVSGSLAPPNCLARNDLNMMDPLNYRGPSP